MMEGPNRTEGPDRTEKTGKLGLWGCLGIFGAGFFLFLSVSAVAICWSFASCCASGLADTGDKQAETEFLAGDPDSETVIAVIDIRGIIQAEDDGFSTRGSASPEKICALIREAAEASEVKAILIRLDTPGGEVTASDVIRRELEKCGKPVVAQMESLAASGGYFIATSARKIVANRTTMTGSIGVVIRTLNYHKLFRLIGLRECVYASGQMKAMLSGGREITAQEEKIVRDLVMETFEEFLKAVSDSRKIPLEKLRKSDFCDGRILSGAQALKAGLVDRLGYFSDAVEEAEKLAGIPAGSAKVVRYKSGSRLLEDILASVSAPAQRLSVSLTAGPAEGFTMTPGKAYFLPAFP